MLRRSLGLDSLEFKAHKKDSDVFIPFPGRPTLQCIGAVHKWRHHWWRAFNVGQKLNIRCFVTKFVLSWVTRTWWFLSFQKVTVPPKHLWRDPNLKRLWRRWRESESRKQTTPPQPSSNLSFTCSAAKLQSWVKTKICQQFISLARGPAASY